MADFKTQDIPQLEKMVADKREALRTLRFNAAGSRSRNVKEGKELRKEVARILTELSARSLSAKAEIAGTVKQG